MGDYTKIFNSICRLCLRDDNDDSKMVSLIANDQENSLSVYGELVSNFVDIYVKNEDNLPKNICLKCKKVLDKINSFKSVWTTNQMRMKNLMNLYTKNKVSGNEIMKSFCEYIIYCQYFPDYEEMPRENLSKSKPKTMSNIETDIPYETRIEPNYLKMEDQSSPKLSNSASEVENENVDYTTTNYSENNTKTKGEKEIDNLFDIMEKYFTKQRKKLTIDEKKQRKIKLKRNLTCNICNRTLANLNTYNHHMQRHTKFKFICDRCGKGYPLLCELKRHQIRRHNATALYKCDHCSYEGALKHELIEHIRLHTGERPFTCEKCGLTFRRQAIYKQHLKKHEEKTIQCTVCPKKFYNRGHMLMHKNNVHERLYLYLCRVCEVSYARTGSVRKHMAIKHGIPREAQGKIIRITRDGNMSLFHNRKN